MIEKRPGFINIAIPRKLRGYLEKQKILTEEPIYKVLYRMLKLKEGEEIPDELSGMAEHLTAKPPSPKTKEAKK